MIHVQTPIALETECVASSPSDWRALGDATALVIGRVALLQLRVISPEKGPRVMDIGHRQVRPPVEAAIG
jgi:hypothetical protein